jgi:predicted dehydrogenase
MPKLRLIQCGVGGFGAGWVKNHTIKSPDFDLVAVVDIADKALKEAGDLAGLGEDRRFKSLEAAVDKVQADAVLTVTPPAVHAQHAKIAFSRGLHLMSEKPMADTLDNARLMAQCARQAGRQLVISQNYRYSPPIHRLRQLLAQKVVGELGHGHIDFYIPADFTGTFRQTMEYVLLVDMAIHHMDLIRYVTGRNITKVTAQTFRPAWSWYAHHNGLKMLLELDGGLPLSYSGDWSAKGRLTGWNGSWRLQCAEGSLHLEPEGITIGRCEKWSKNPSSEKADVPEIAPTGQAATLALFAEAIRSGKPAQISGEDNLWSFGAVMAGVASAKEGRTVDVGALVGR